MKNHGQAVAGVLSLAFVVSLAAPLHAAKYKIHWFLGHQNLDYFEEAALGFKKAVETGSNGDIAVDIVVQAEDHRAQIAAQGPQIAAMVAKGEVEMGHSFADIMGGVDPRYHAFEAPYLFRGYRHLEGVFEGPLGTEMLEGLRAHGILGLSFTYSGGANGVATTERELRRPEDLKGLKVGVFDDEVNKAWLESLGATPVSIEHGQEQGIVSSVWNGALDATVITWRNFERATLNTNFKYVNLMDSNYLVSVTYINEKFFDSLPEKYRALITKASREAGRVERAKTIELNARAKLEMLGKGVRAVYLTQENRRRFAKALRPAYERSIERVIGKDLIERIRNTSDAPEHPSIPIELAHR